jgi:Zn-finger nucleic acid-binding protein
MNCPRCDTKTGVRQIQDVGVDDCAACGGVFLDRGELNRVTEAIDGDLEYSTLHEDRADVPDSLGPIGCPSCDGGTMHKVEFLVHTGIILDHCRSCGGFWLDGKELERINAYVHDLNESSEDLGSPAMQWFAQFLFSLPR